MFVLRRFALIVAAGVLAVTQGVAQPEPAPAWQLCSGFSEEQQHKDPPLSWKFRSCTIAQGERDVQLQFKNRSAEAVTFEFRLWTQQAPRSCKTDEPEPAARGRRQLAGNAADALPYTVSTLNDGEDFTGRIWVCVREVPR